LRLVLEELRRRGCSFDDAWTVALEHTGRDKDLLGEMETVWRANYERVASEVASLHSLRGIPDRHSDIPSHLRRVS
jgi:hypothetical protein